jgi:hypothetical protein
MFNLRERAVRKVVSGLHKDEAEEENIPNLWPNSTGPVSFPLLAQNGELFMVFHC